MGISGRTWLLLHKSYINFKCQVRIQNKLSETYELRCGIHQGGYLALIKYIAFINYLLLELETSGLCCAINGIGEFPLGYADDIAIACTG